MEATEPIPPVAVKKWYRSKTLWTMALALVALVAQMAYGFVLAPEEELGILAVIGLVLRAFTKEGLEK
jgi:hypothetical protein